MGSVSHIHPLSHVFLTTAKPVATCHFRKAAELGQPSSEGRECRFQPLSEARGRNGQPRRPLHGEFAALAGLRGLCDLGWNPHPLSGTFQDPSGQR